jgi:hypothetical protein
MASASGWRWFAAWAAAGALVVFSVLALPSIGLFVLPFALVACWLAARGSRDSVDALGALSGGGLVCVVIVSLGGFDLVPWIAVGIVLLLAGPVAFAVLRRRDPRATVG